jgi:hypothetical protein
MGCCCLKLWRFRSVLPAARSRDLRFGGPMRDRRCAKAILLGRVVSGAPPSVLFVALRMVELPSASLTGEPWLLQQCGESHRKQHSRAPRDFREIDGNAVAPNSTFH